MGGEKRFFKKWPLLFSLIIIIVMPIAFPQETFNDQTELPLVLDVQVSNFSNF
jgi:ABC-type transport system involved in cytochrome c biogenesis permease component